MRSAISLMESARTARFPPRGSARGSLASSGCRARWRPPRAPARRGDAPSAARPCRKPPRAQSAATANTTNKDQPARRCFGRQTLRDSEQLVGALHRHAHVHAITGVAARSQELAPRALEQHADAEVPRQRASEGVAPRHVLPALGELRAHEAPGPLQVPAPAAVARTGEVQRDRDQEPGDQDARAEPDEQRRCRRDRT